MNYLAHAFLSFHEGEILVGNLISDFVKGKKKFDYPPGIQVGIALHRAIDEFTDQHASTRLAKNIFKDHYRLYSAAFVDVVYDHFLANDPGLFNDTSLMEFSQWVYTSLTPYENLFPEPFNRMFPFMRQQNWLFHYKFRTGIQSSFRGLVRRARYLDESETAFRLFEENYISLQKCYDNFFPDMQRFAEFSLTTIRKELDGKG